MIGCNCSEAQLYRVGCECVEMIVEVWPRGYAHESGLVRLRMAHCADHAFEARKICGMSASVYSVREAYPIQNFKKFDAAYVKEMSMGG
jgi:hypothetical protein